jgi:hypothetical protein
LRGEKGEVLKQKKGRRQREDLKFYVVILKIYQFA